jgi:methylated-DNA-[protein]-cysteine S-methyltransferase
MKEDATLYQCYYLSPLGNILIRCTDESIIQVTFTENEDAKEECNTHSLLAETVAQLKSYFDRSLQQFDLPLNPQGTSFQKQVWKDLEGIKFGKTSSYFQMSKQLGNEKAIRAVGNANGKNPVAIIIPCHRVIGSDGSLIGYSGKLWRKKWLLEHELSIITKQMQLQF